MRDRLPTSRVWISMVCVGCFALMSWAQPAPPSAGTEKGKQDSASMIRARAEWFYKQRRQGLGYIPRGARLRALRRMQQMRLADQAEQLRLAAAGAPVNTTAIQWTSIGPQPTTNPSYGNVSGRVTALVVDPGNSSIVYLGAADGGVWKTTDGGQHWIALSDAQPSLSIGSLALDPNNSSIVYAGTGEGNFNSDAYFGAGILKSTDGGATWNQLAGPFLGPTNSIPPSGGANIGAIAVQPGNGNVLLAAFDLFNSSTLYGFGGNIARSTDGGVNWTGVLTGGSQFALGADATDVLFDPTNGNIAYAAFGQGFVTGAPGAGIYRSIDGGQTWKSIPGTGANSLPPAANMGRISMAIAPSAHTTLFASVADPSTGHLLGLFRSTDSGTNWTQLSVPDYCGSSGQCFYDNKVVVNPTKANVVYAGGEEFTVLYQSLDGGTTWNLVQTGANLAELHPDLHALAFDSSGAVLYVGNDGGVWSSNNPNAPASQVNWIDLNATLDTIQFYPNLGVGPSNPNSLWGGTQDNGVEQYSGTLTWNDPSYCGDGAAAAIDFSNANNVYVACNALITPINIGKSTNGGASFTKSVTGIGNDRVAFIPPMIMDPVNSQRLYFGTSKLYQTNNGAGLWTPISPDFSAMGTVSAIAVAPSNNNFVYVGTDDTVLQFSSNANNGATATWTTITGNLPTQRVITGIAVDKSNPATVFVTVSGFGTGHVFTSTNAASASWADISSNLPDIPVNAIVEDPTSANTLYIGTDVGVFFTNNGGGSWSPLGSGLPNVAVTDLKLQTATGFLFAGTHGRGVWKLPVISGFTLGTLSPGSVNVAADGTSTPAITFQVTANGSLAGPVDLTCPSGLPTGSVCNFSPSNSVNPVPGTPVTVTLTVTAAGSAVGTYSVTVAADSTGQTEQTQTFLLHVLPDYSYTVTNPVLYTTPGALVSFNGTLTTGNGYGNTVTVTCGVGKPSTCTPPGALVPSLGGTAANVTAGNSSTGDFSFNLNATGNDLLTVSRSQAVTLHVIQVSFSTQPPSTVTVAQGSTSGAIPLQITATGSFTGSVTLSCPGLPFNASCSFSPSATVSPTSGSPANVTMTINSGSAAAGNYPGLTVSGSVTNPTLTITSTAYTLSITNTGIPADLQARVVPAAGQPAILPVGARAAFKVTATNATSAPGPVNVTLIFSISAPNLLGVQNGCTLAGASLSCNIPNLTFGTPVTVNFTTAPLPFTVRSLTATAIVSAANPESPPGDNTQTTNPVPVGPRPISRKNLTTLPK